MSHLGWKLPKNHFDCYVENRNLFNGILPKQPKKLWGLEETIKRFKLKTDHNPNVSSKYGIRSIPTLMIFKGGQKVDTVVGAVPKATLSSTLSKHL